MRLGLYLRTIRHLRTGQIAARVRRYFPQRKPAAPREIVWRSPEVVWTAPPAWQPPSLQRGLEMRIHGRSIAWGDTSVPALHAYHVHYHDDLNALDADSRHELHRELLRRWMTEYPAGIAPAWDAYPTSLRIVNWIHWLLRGGEPEAGMLQSLAQQAAWLSSCVELDVLANHILANAKALVFAGTVFEGAAADRWLERGLSIIRRELDEQILADGGHFERSPMYQSIIVTDLLDLESLRRAYPRRLHALDTHTPRIARMLRWLLTMTHPDGEIALFNDAAIGVAPPPDVVIARAAEMNIAPSPARNDLRESGYARLERGAAVVIADVGEIGPDYQPGHAHADTLSFEMSLHGERFIVDAGTSGYENSPARAWERSTAAHNTVTVRGENSSEVWSSFRVGRRARIRDVEISESGDEATVSGCHDGFAGVLHCRTWRLRDESLIIEDQLSGEARDAAAYLHFAPGTRLSLAGRGAEATTAGGTSVRLEVEGADARIVESSYRPHFGVSIPNEALCLSFHGARATARILWNS